MIIPGSADLTNSPSQYYNEPSVPRKRIQHIMRRIRKEETFGTKKGWRAICERPKRQSFALEFVRAQKNMRQHSERKQKEIVKRTPFLFMFTVQLYSLVFIALLVFPFVETLTWPILWLPTGIISFVWLCDLVVLILSLTIWWNVPIRISTEGIIDKHGSLRRYSDAVKISMKKWFGTQYGPYYVVTIAYKEGATISFERSDLILKKIRTRCQDDTFLAMLEEGTKLS